MSTTEQLSFIKKLGEPASKFYATSGLLPSLMIAQGILESGWGESELAQSSNNLFGIRGSYKGESVSSGDDDVASDGTRIPVVVPFRKYPSVAESMQDHSDFLSTKRYFPVRNAKTYQEGAQALLDCGYAGDREYPQKLVRIIEQHKLYEWDEKAKALAGEETESEKAKRLKLEAEAKAKAEAEAKKKTHTVVKGDTVYAISKKYNTTVDKIQKLNNLDKNYTIAIGQKLKVE